MNHLDLFSGIGGFALAARWAGIETIAFCEKDPFCRRVLHKHWPGGLKYMDIRDVAHPDHADIMTAGFPCQPFSIAGKKRGKDDDRYLWPEVIRLIRISRPKWFIGENVPGIIPMLDPILEDLERENYTWRAYLIPASATGAPHKRERLWIIAHADTEQRHEMAACSITLTERSERSNVAAKSGDVISDTNSITSKQTNSRTFAEQKEWDSWMGYPRQFGEDKTLFNWEEDEPPIPGVDDGLPFGLDRNKALGNAIVPQIAYVFMKMIRTITDEQTNMERSTRGNGEGTYEDLQAKTAPTREST